MSKKLADLAKAESWDDDEEDEKSDKFRIKPVPKGEKVPIEALGTMYSGFGFTIASMLCSIFGIAKENGEEEVARAKETVQEIMGLCLAAVGTPEEFEKVAKKYSGKRQKSEEEGEEEDED